MVENLKNVRKNDKSFDKINFLKNYGNVLLLVLIAIECTKFRKSFEFFNIYFYDECHNIRG